MNIIAHIKGQAGAALPHGVIAGVIGLCVLPFLLNLAGWDFGSASIPMDHQWATNAPTHLVIDAHFFSLAGAFTHTLLEWSAFCVAAFVAYLALGHYRITRDVTTPIIGLAFFAAGSMDAFHTLAADRLIEEVADNRDLIPFTWAICRIFNAAIMIAGVSLLLSRGNAGKKQPGYSYIAWIALGFGIVAYAIIRICATVENLPQTTYPGALITRPYDALPLVMFVVAGLYVYPRLYQRYPSLFTHALIISALPQVVTQLHMTFGSTALFDNHFNIAHFMKVVAYTVPLVGLTLDYMRGHRLLKGEVAAREKTEDALKQSETQHRTVLETMVDAHLTINDTGQIQTLNPAASAMFGYRADEVVGKNISMLMPNPYHKEHDGYLARYRDTGERRIMGSIREVKALRKNGQEFPVELSVSELLVDNERLFSGIVRDITDRKRAELMKDEFISTVSHELRTPLTSIRGSLGLLVGGAVGKMEDKAKNLLKIANENTERLLLLINDLLDMEKVASGNMAFQFKLLPVGRLIKQAVAANIGYAQQYEVRIIIAQNADDDIKVFADEERLMQVLANLLSNAAKFSGDGKTIEITAVRCNHSIRISVTDHGHGISEAFRAKVFDKFTQSDASDTRRQGGTGLGLAISKAIIEKHGGHIGFVSELKIGSTFYFDLPAYEQTQMTTDLVAPRPSRPAPVPHILVVEDDKDVAGLLRMMLSQSGYNADIARSAKEAKELLDQHHYAAITLDILLPDQDGISFLKDLRSQAQTQNIPVVVVSAKANIARHEINGGAVGIVDWLDKPINEDRLMSAIQQATTHTTAPRILHVEDEPDISQTIQALLSEEAKVINAPTLAEARRRLDHDHYDLVLLDVHLPDGSGLELLERLNQANEPIPTVIFTAIDVSEEVSAQVAASLTKFTTSNQELTQTIRSLLQNRSQTQTT